MNFVTGHIEFSSTEFNWEEPSKNEGQEQEQGLEGLGDGLLLGYSLTQTEEGEEKEQGEHAVTDEVGKNEEEDKKEENKNKLFGVLKLHVLDTDNTTTTKNKPLNAYVFLDRSGSMSDMVDPQHSKLDYVKATFQRMCLYMVEKQLPLALNLWAFDDKVEEFIPFQDVHADNIQEISKKIHRIMPRDCTNIGKALDYGFQVIQEQRVLSSSTSLKPNHLFVLLTDGQPTSGIQDKFKLRQKLQHIKNEDHSTTLVTVGCGNDVDGQLLRFLNADFNCLVDKFENTGIVCGEFLDKVIHTLACDVLVTVEHGEIYHWQTNKWTTSLCISHLVDGHDRTYHVRSATPDLLTVSLKGISALNDLPIEMVVNEKRFDQDLVRYHYRQETLELLTRVRLFNETFDYDNKKTLRLAMKNLLERMKAYMDEKNIRESDCEEGKFMRLLCDDIVYAYRNMGSVAKTHLLYARQTTQGEQQIYSVQDDDDHDNENKTHYKRNRLFGPYFQEQEQEDSQFDHPPKLCRAYTDTLNLMKHDDDAETEQDTDADADADDLQHCSLRAPAFKLQTLVEQENDQDYSIKCASTEQEQEDEIFTQHKMCTWDLSPYQCQRTVTVMRSLSVKEDQNSTGGSSSVAINFVNDTEF